MVVIMHEINFKTFNMDIFISIMCILYGFICWDVVSTYGNSFTFNIYFFYCIFEYIDYLIPKIILFHIKHLIGSKRSQPRGNSKII